MAGVGLAVLIAQLIERRSKLIDRDDLEDGVDGLLDWQARSRHEQALAQGFVVEWARLLPRANVLDGGTTRRVDHRRAPAFLVGPLRKPTALAIE